MAVWAVLCWKKIAVRNDCRIVAGVDREAGKIGEIPVYAGFDALPLQGRNQ